MGMMRYCWMRGATLSLLLAPAGCVTIAAPDNPRPALPLAWPQGAEVPSRA